LRKAQKIFDKTLKLLDNQFNGFPSLKGRIKFDALLGLAHICYLQGRYPKAETYYDELSKFAINNDSISLYPSIFIAEKVPINASPDKGEQKLKKKLANLRNKRRIFSILKKLGFIICLSLIKKRVQLRTCHTNRSFCTDTFN
jgi:tetratricopeptide (TPR) repeat protein